MAKYKIDNWYNSEEGKHWQSKKHKEYVINLILEAKENHPYFLDLSMCGLRVLPDELFLLSDTLQILRVGMDREWDFSPFNFSGTRGISFNLSVTINDIETQIPYHTLPFSKGWSEYNCFDSSALLGLRRVNNLKHLFINGRCYVKDPNDCLNEYYPDLEDEDYYSENRGVTSILKNENLIFLEYLPNLQTLDIGSNGLNLNHSINNREYDLNSFSHLKSLKSLYIEQNWLTDTDFLSPLKNLTYLSLRMNPIKSINGLEFLTNLEELNLIWTSIEDLKYIEKMKKLKSLYVHTLKPTEGVMSLLKLTRLEQLKLQILDEDIEIIAKITNLKYLDISYSHESLLTIEPLSNLLNLYWLNLEGNNIRYVYDLWQLSNIEYLNLSHNSIRDIEGIERLIKLECLYVNDNQIEDLDSIKEMTNLKQINFDNNFIKGIDPFYQLYEKIQEQNKTIEYQNRKLSIKNEIINKQNHEIYHNMKNNLQLLINLLAYHKEQFSDTLTQEAMEDLEMRIETIGMIHTLLYRQENVSFIHLPSYIKQLTSSIKTLISGRLNKSILMNLHIADLQIDPEATTYTGLIINELLINAYKHAFYESEQPQFDITVKTNQLDMLHIQLKDNGKGIPIELIEKPEKGFGLRFIQDIIQNMNGSIETKLDIGTQFDIYLQLKSIRQI